MKRQALFQPGNRVFECGKSERQRAYRVGFGGVAE